MLLWIQRHVGGRPDPMKLIKEVYKYWNAEGLSYIVLMSESEISSVVFITSNWHGNQEVMEGCKEAGIPAFGTLWDF